MISLKILFPFFLSLNFLIGSTAQSDPCHLAFGETPDGWTKFSFASEDDFKVLKGQVIGAVIPNSLVVGGQELHVGRVELIVATISLYRDSAHVKGELILRSLSDNSTKEFSLQNIREIWVAGPDEATN